MLVRHRQVCSVNLSKKQWGGGGVRGAEEWDVAWEGAMPFPPAPLPKNF